MCARVGGRMKDGRSKNPRQEEGEREFARHGEGPIRREVKDFLVTLASITLWKVRALRENL